jgi:chromosome partitioning protein
MAGKVIVAATAKGGAGKSTSVACLALHWTRAGRKVALVDTDDNRTLTRWHGKGSLLGGLPLRTETQMDLVLPAIQALKAKADVVLVDCAGANTEATIFAVGAADLVLIPVMTDEANLFEALRMRKVVESAAKLTRRQIIVRTFLNRTKRAAVTDHTRQQLVAFGAPPLKASLPDRAVFQEASFHGASPSVLSPKSPATRDIAALAHEIEAILWPD